MRPTIPAVRAELIRLVSVRDIVVSVSIGIIAVAAGAVMGTLLDGPPTTVNGYPDARGDLPLLEFALPLWCAAVAALRAGERRLGIDLMVRIAVPNALRSFAAGATAALVAGVVVGSVLGAVSGAPLLLDQAGPTFLAHIGRVAAVVAFLTLVGFAVGSLLRNEMTAWVLVLVWCFVGERLLASIPSLGPVIGGFLPVRNADYFVFGDAHGAPYAWGAPLAIIVPAGWAVLALGLSFVLSQAAHAPRRKEPLS